MDISRIEIRKVKKSEGLSLQEISKFTFIESFGQYNTQSDLEKYTATSFDISQVNSELKNPESGFYFAMLEEKIVGYLKVNVGQAQTDHELKNALEIERVYVRSEFQGKQIGQELFKRTIELAEAQNISHIWLGVWDQNDRAIRFYERHGFVKFGNHPFKLGDDDQIDILMKYELKK
jgi:ribosomal protein S18 acetylase RimI-like enzyme